MGLSWTQPICDACWFALNPDRDPTRLNEITGETCCHCGKETVSGIYIRVDPKTVAHPSVEKD